MVLVSPSRKERDVAQEFSQGDTVEWNTPQGKTRGTVKKKLTSDTEVGGQKVSASEDDPRYLVESENSGKEAAHKPDSLSKA
jgi:Hypervirulence associated proteins TUDOR domain